MISEQAMSSKRTSMKRWRGNCRNIGYLSVKIDNTVRGRGAMESYNPRTRCVMNWLKNAVFEFGIFQGL